MRLFFPHTKISTSMLANTVLGAHVLRGGISLPTLHLMKSRACNWSGYMKNTWFTITAKIQLDFPLLQQSVHEAGSPTDILLTNISFSLFEILRHSCIFFIPWMVKSLNMNMMSVNYSDLSVIRRKFMFWWRSRSSLGVRAGIHIRGRVAQQKQLGFALYKRLVA